ncbi:MAG: tetratricopeptide repeat protein [Phycisphaerales bacterium]|nr:tetratricopeptide repeat protein [Phycisphaerales bacterium]
MPPPIASILSQAQLLMKQRRPDQAEAVLRQGLRVHPREAGLHHQLAIALIRQNRLEPALTAAFDAVELAPSSPGPINTLASLLHMSRRLFQAELWARKGLEIDERHAPLHNTLGTLLSEQHRIEEACAEFRRAVELQPDRYDSQVNLARLLARLGRPDEALEFMGRVAELRPDDIEMQAGYAFDLNYSDRARPAQVLEAHRRLGALYARGAGGPAAFPNTRDPRRRLRVAYLSADCRGHSVSYFFEPIVEHHDRERYEVYIYSGTQEGDAVTQRLQSYPVTWRETYELGDAALVELARRDEIDIAIDLSGLTIGNRLSAMARRIAPVQITYLGYPNTTGLATMDWRIVDAITDPPGSESLMTERPLRLPGCFLCYRPPGSAPEVAPPPALRSGSVTFGSFNNLAKTSPTAVALWSEVLKRVPGSKLVLRAKILAASIAESHLRGRFEREGVDPARIELLDYLPGHSDHMSLYNRVDIALDTFPYHGTTTTCEAMWMGVPVVTLEGQVHAARVGSSLLHAVGCPELIARSREEFVDIAARLAGDAPALAQRRAGLRARMAGSILCDQRSFIAKFESALRDAWLDRCAGPGGGA